MLLEYKGKGSAIAGGDGSAVERSGEKDLVRIWIRAINVS
jgi:hypothetical protein